MRVFCVLVSLIINARDAKRISLFSFFLLLLLLLSSVCLTEFFFVHLLRSKKRLLFLSRRFSSHHKRVTFRTLLPKNTTKKRPHAPKKVKKRCLFFLPLLGCLLETLWNLTSYGREVYISDTHLFVPFRCSHIYTHTRARAIFINYSNKNAIFTISRNDHDSRRCRHGTFYSYFAFVFVFVFGVVFRRRKSFVFVDSLVVIVRGVRYLIRDG